ncbi:hypothetical protein IDM40_00945 [Nocardiopsis sp. HNM0947]|uniref:Uncharacterized protein n=1 Tax=Nocardiopsis coralli TaxID=2772213 RepID=A0ABR9P0C6_9ACTN|nr:hypothetical protein [Nocardiopsis coralli]MBE2997272.1 hypothetical protein [Nocardiopsis coralli]
MPAPSSPSVPRRRTTWIVVTLALAVSASVIGLAVAALLPSPERSHEPGADGPALEEQLDALTNGPDELALLDAPGWEPASVRTDGALTVVYENEQGDGVTVRTLPVDGDADGLLWDHCSGDRCAEREGDAVLRPLEAGVREPGEVRILLSPDTVVSVSVRKESVSGELQMHTLPDIDDEELYGIARQAQTADRTEAEETIREARGDRST